MTGESDKVKQPDRPDSLKYQVGRPTAFTEERKQAIIDNILDGAYRTPAAVATGISETTWFRWNQIARKQELAFWAEFDERHGEDADIFSVPEDELPETHPYLEFLWQVEEAEAESEQQLVKIVKTAAPDDWKAALEMLSRKQSTRWAREAQKHQLSLGGGDGDTPGKGFSLSINYVSTSNPEEKPETAG